MVANPSHDTHRALVSHSTWIFLDMHDRWRAPDRAEGAGTTQNLYSFLRPRLNCTVNPAIHV